MKRNQVVSVSVGGNLERARKVQELRRSGASGSHGDRRLRRQRTRASIRSTAIREG